MRYLVTWKLLPVPPEMAKMALSLLKATETWIEKQKTAGFLIEAWQYTEGMGGVAIVEAKSNDALYLKLMSSPFSPFQQYCVTPLTDMKLAIEDGMKSYQKIIGKTKS